jgi:hypothetical protein
MSKLDNASMTKIPEITYEEVNLNGLNVKSDDDFRWKGDDDKVALAEIVNKKIED